MMLLKILNNLDPDCNIATTIKNATEQQKAQASALGLFLIPVLNGYDNHQTAKRLQDVILYLQESAMFENEEHRFAIVDTLQTFAKAFSGIDILLLDDLEDVKKSFAAYM